MPLPRLRAAWWFVMIGLSAMLSLNYVLPLLNTPVAEYTPFHTHLLIGGSAAGRAWLLTHHQHGVTPAPATKLPAPAATDTPTITSGSSLGDVLDLAGGGALLVAFTWPAAHMPLALWALLLPAALLLISLSPPPPDRPPRRA